MQVKSAKVLYNKLVAPGHFVIGLEWAAKSIRPGQFVMLRVDSGLDPLLRRPFGIYKLIGAKGRGPYGAKGIELIYHVVGKGTSILSEKVAGEYLSILGPIGNGFSDPPKSKKFIMVAGGIGIAPMYLVAKKAARGVLLYGSRSKSDNPLVAGFSALGCKVKRATEDGSAGVKGYVTALLEKEITEDSVVYACGPIGMLKAVSEVALRRNVKCHVSLERSMACGIGVCLGCAIKTRSHAQPENRIYKMVCSDGPVFDSAEIDWGML